MTVKEIVLLAAEELRIQAEVSSYLKTNDSAGKEKTQLLLNCFNLVENELALDYLPLTTTEKVQTSTGQVQFSALKNAPVRILKVENRQGEEVPFTLYPKYLTSEKGELLITYTYTPEPKTIHDESDFSGNVSARLMAFGMAAEYTMAMGEFQESGLWDKKYKDAIAAICPLKTSKKMASRRWV